MCKINNLFIKFICLKVSDDEDGDSVDISATELRDDIGATELWDDIRASFKCGDIGDMIDDKSI